MAVFVFNVKYNFFLNDSYSVSMPVKYIKVITFLFSYIAGSRKCQQVAS